MAEIVAVYEVLAGTTANVDVDTASMTPNMIASYLQEDAHPGISLCHQCAHDVIDPEVGDLVAFTVDGVSFAFNEELGQWEATP